MSKKTHVARNALAVVAAAGMAVTGLTAPAQAAPTTDAPAAVAKAAAPKVTTTTRYITSQDKYGTMLFEETNAVENAKGVVVVVHGATEHHSRYDYITKKLNEAGYTVYRIDNRGHGKSANPYVNNTIPRGHIDDWHNFVGDIHTLVHMAKKENPGQNIFLVGHSLGAMTVQSYGIKYPGDVKGIVSTGGGIFINPTTEKNSQKAERITSPNLTAAERKAKPNPTTKLPLQQVTSYQSKLLPLALKDPGNFAVPSPITSVRPKVYNLAPGKGVCTDRAVADDYKYDPLINKFMTPGMMQQMAVGQLYNAFNAPNFKEPTLIMHGEADGLMPPYLDDNWLNAISSKDKTSYLWTGLMHEIYNEPVKNEPIKITVDWINNHNK